MWGFGVFVMADGEGVVAVAMLIEGDPLLLKRCGEGVGSDAGLLERLAQGFIGEVLALQLLLDLLLCVVLALVADPALTFT